MPEDYILAIDEGTTGITALLLDAEGRIRARSYREITQYFPAPGWVEHDPREIFARFVDAGRQAIHDAGIAPGAVRALGLTNQRETVVAWDRRSREPAARAVVWQCKRSLEICRDLAARGLEPTFRERTGLRLDPYFSGTKLRWLIDHAPAVRALRDAGHLAVGTVDSWLIANLTGDRAHVTDATNASRTLAFDIHRRAWDDALLAYLGVPAAALPAVRDPCATFGECDPVHFGAPIPILGVAGDQQAALFGHGGVRPGDAKCTFGTGAFAMLQCGATPRAPTDGLLLTLACGEDGAPTYALEGSIFMAGAVVQWLRDQLGAIARADETEALARSIADSGGVFLVPAFAGLGTPHWNPRARAAILGMTRGTGRAHLARAALEAIAFQARELLDAFAAANGAPPAHLDIDGGVAENGFFVEFLADIMGLPVRRSTLVERTAWGAGLLASRHPDVRARFAFALPRPETFSPRVDAAEREARMDAWRRAVASVIHFAS